MPWRPDYVTPEELAVFVHTDVEEERAELEGACASGSRAIDTATYRQFGSVAAQARIYTPQWSTKLGMWTIECDDFTALTVLEIDTAGDGTFSTSVSLSGTVPLPYNAVEDGLVYERVAVRRSVLTASTLGPGSARLTSAWGWPSVPTSIKSAAKLQASRFFNRRNSPYGIAGSPDQGSEVRLLAKADPDVIVSVRPFKRAVWLS